MSIVSYPAESFSIESHIFIMVVATIVTIVGLIFGLIVSKREKINQGKYDVIVKDIVPVSGIILALAGPVITAAFNPVLDYSVSEDSTKTGMNVNINNYGLVGAKGIEIYFSTPGKDFVKFISVPIINGTSFTTSEKLGLGSGIFYIPTLPPRSETQIMAAINSTLESNDKTTVYVRSEKSTGIHQVVPLSYAYMTYSLVIVFDVLFIIGKKWKLDGWSEVVLLIVINLAAAIVIFCILFFGFCEGTGNCLSYGVQK